jgi:2-haloacid dehalogenase
MTAARLGRNVSAHEVEDVVGAMSRLPAHAEVPGALGRLRAAGFRLTALTNSVLEVATAQLTHAGLIDLFEAVFSADEVRALKPAPLPYRMVAQRCGVDIGDVCLVAAHAWDVSGALAAGCQAALVSRAGVVPSPVGEQPTVAGADLTEVADALLKRFVAA